MAQIKRVSMRDLAREAGVSVMTVSLALRNQPGVSEETRHRIQKLAKAKGYRPDPALSALISYRRNKTSQGHLGAVAFLNFQGERTNPEDYINQMYRGASERANSMGYKVYLFSGPTTEVEAARLKRILRSRGIQGILISPVGDISNPPLFDWDEFTIVCLGVSFARRIFHTVSGDTYHGGFLCAAQLHHAGCKRIGLYFTKNQIDRVEQRYTGGAAAYISRTAGDVTFIPPLYTDEYPVQRYSRKSQMEKDLLNWYETHRPDGIITGFGGMKSFLEQKRIPIPDHFSLTCPYSLGGQITYIDQRFAEWGIWAMNTLGGLLKNNEVGIPALPVETLIRGRLVHQGSIAGNEFSYEQELDAGMKVCPVLKT